MTSPAALGVVIPTLNEAEHLPLLLADLTALNLPHRVVVVDAGSEDETAARARGAGAQLLESEPGRARQMNAGARALDSVWLLFLHADCRLTAEAGAALIGWLDSAGAERAATFRFSLNGEGGFWRFIEFGQRLRQRLSGMAYGDQGLVLSRALFEEVGGFPDQPLMEDVAMIRRLRAVGSVDLLPAALLTSPRRYEREGRWRGWLRNVALIGLYLAGVSPERLARWYPSRTAADE